MRPRETRRAATSCDLAHHPGMGYQRDAERSAICRAACRVLFASGLRLIGAFVTRHRCRYRRVPRSAEVSRAVDDPQWRARNTLFGPAAVKRRPLRSLGRPICLMMRGVLGVRVGCAGMVLVHNRVAAAARDQPAHHRERSQSPDQ